MAAKDLHFVERFRKPEYTGENRCIPCTAVNVVLSAALGAGLGAAVAVPAGVTAGVPVGVAAFLLGIAATYLRGYLVPGTPTLTKRYFPDSVLARFDKLDDPGLDPELEAEAEAQAAKGDLVAPETVLFDSGVVVETADGEDVDVDPEFREEWRRNVERIREEGTERRVLGEVLAVDEELVTIEYGERYSEFAPENEGVLATVEGRTVGLWESRAALIADLAAAGPLRERYPGWDSLFPMNQGSVLRALRLFVETCPSCAAPVAARQEVVESCCRDKEVPATVITCEECGSLIIEATLDVEQGGAPG